MVLVFPDKKPPKALDQREDKAQQDVVTWLDSRGYLFTATANGIWTSKSQGSKLKRTGVKAGVPDILIFDPPPARNGAVGLALEMKRASCSKSNISEKQLSYMFRLEEKNWLCVVAFGADQAIKALISFGY